MPRDLKIKLPFKGKITNEVAARMLGVRLLLWLGLAIGTQVRSWIFVALFTLFVVGATIYDAVFRVIPEEEIIHEQL